MKGALLSEDPHNQLAIAYHLIVDNKRFQDANNMYSIKDFYNPSSPPPVAPPPFSPPDQSPIKPHPERIARTLLNNLLVQITYSAFFISSKRQSIFEH